MLIPRGLGQQLWHHTISNSSRTPIQNVEVMAVTPPESLFFSQKLFSPSFSELFSYTNEASWHYAASWLFAVSNFKLFKIKDFFSWFGVFFPCFWLGWFGFCPFPETWWDAVSIAYWSGVISAGWKNITFIIKITPTMPLKLAHHSLMWLYQFLIWISKKELSFTFCAIFLLHVICIYTW